MAKANSYFPVQIPIYSLSGGIGKQIPSKRLPTECSKLSNFFCTTQSSLDKRNGFRVQPLTNVATIEDDANKVDNYFYYWMDVDAKTSYLFIVNTNIETSWIDDYPEMWSLGAPKGFLTVMKITDTGEGVNYITSEKFPTNQQGEDNPYYGSSCINYHSWKYLTYKDPDNYLPAQKRLEAVTIGSSVLIVNKQVKAGFTTVDGKLELDWSNEDNTWVSTEQLKGFDGVELANNGADAEASNADFLGGNIKYLTASAVDPEHKAQIWNEYADYTWGNTVIDTEDPVYKKDVDDDGLGNDAYPYQQFRGRTWDDAATEVVGGATFILDLNSEVTYLDGAGGVYHSNSNLGNQITFRGITTDLNGEPGEPQELNYVFMHKENNLVVLTGTEHYFTTDGNVKKTDDSNKGTGPQRARTIVVNPRDHEGTTKATATLETPPSFWWWRHWNNSFMPDTNGDGEIWTGTYQSDAEDYIPAPQGDINIDNNPDGLRKTTPAGTQTGNEGFTSISQRTNAGTNYNRMVYDSDDPQSLQYIELKDTNGLKCRFYSGFQQFGSPNNRTASVPWAPYAGYNDGSATETDIRNSNILGYNTSGRLFDAFTGNDQGGNTAIGLCGAINDSDLAISATHDGGRNIVLTQDVAGELGNSEIILNGFNDEDFDPINVGYDNTNYSIMVNNSQNHEDRFFTGGSGTTDNIFAEEYTEHQLGSGYADAAELAKVINMKQSASLIAYANQFSLTNPAPYPGRLIVVQKNPGATTNTSIWYNNFTDTKANDDLDDDIIYDLSSHTANGTVPTNFTGGLDGNSINNTINPTWSPDDINYWQDADRWSQQEQFLTNEEGVPLRFGIWKVRDYLPADELPGPTNLLLAGDETPKGSKLPPHKDKARWERVGTTSSSLVTAAGDEALNVATSEFIPVEDYVYPEADSPQLGQSVKAFSDLNFPPDLTDLQAFNGNFATVQTLRYLYDEDPDTADRYLQQNLTHYQAGQEDDLKGKGKIIYLSAAYQEHSPGWYRYINKDAAPYLKKIRTPGRRTMLDKRRMPQMIYPTFQNEDIETGVWSEPMWGIRPVDWDPRKSGDEETNRGPGIFFDPASGLPQESKIKAMAFYRDRLFLANNDTIVSSASGDWDNFFLEDPENILDTDPLDLMVSSNNYTPVRSLVPFRDFLFVGTDGNTQYELVGSNNIISPKTAEFAPTAFYPMLPDVRPIAMNNNLFFYSDKKLFIYFGQRDAATEQAFEVSRHVENYLPSNIEMATASSYASMVFGLSIEGDNDDTSKLYCYRNQIAGEKVVQNAFFDWEVSFPRWNQNSIFPDGKISFIKASGSNLFAVAIEQKEENVTETSLLYMPLEKDPLYIPRLDKLYQVQGDASDVIIYRHESGTPVSTAYDPDTNRTKIRISEWIGSTLTPVFDTLVTSNGEVVPVYKDTESVLDYYYLEGDWTYTISSTIEGPVYWLDTVTYIGTSFTSSVTLSETFVRDERNNIVPGTLNLRYGLIQTFDSPNFTVLLKKSGKTTSQKAIEYNRTDATDDLPLVLGGPGLFNLPDPQQEYIGRRKAIKDHRSEAAQVKFPIMGFSQDIEVIIQSDNPHPLNIASLQFNGKFKQITRFHSS